MTDQSPWTVLRLLKWTTDYLRESKSPRLDAEVLLAKAMECQRIELYTSFDKVVDDQVRGIFREYVRLRAEGMPVAYVVGEKEFYSRPFRVTKDVLIPRPESEFVMIELLDRVGSDKKTTAPTICDVGTGSGNLAITAAAELPRATVTALDISVNAIGVAQQNAQRHRVADRIRFVESDLFSALDLEQRFDFIVANPPYVSESEFAELEPGVRQYEPRLALVAGPTGMEIIDRILQETVARLRPGGWLIMEISPMLADTVVKRLTANPRLANFTIRTDLAQFPRVASVQV